MIKGIDFQAPSDDSAETHADHDTPTLRHGLGRSALFSSEHGADLFSDADPDFGFEGKVRVVDIPAAVPTDTPTVIFTPGAGFGKEEPTAKKIAASGRDALSYSMSGLGKADQRYAVGRPGSLVEVDEASIFANTAEGDVVIPKQQMLQAEVLLHTLDQRGDGPVDAIFQSESAGHGIIAAYAEPSKFNSIVLAFPGSFEAQPERREIGRRMRAERRVAKEHRPSKGENFTKGFRNKVLAARAMAQAMRSPGDFLTKAAGLQNSSLASLLHEMKQRDDAPPVTLVAGLDDNIFPLERYFETMVSSQDVDRIVIVPGGHAITGRPEVLDTILEQFPAMESLDEEFRARPLKDRIVFPEGISRERADEIFAMADRLDQRTEAAK